MQSSPSASPVLVVGGGIAGMQAALDLAGLGVPVFLAEKDGHLGGQVMRLDKVYPTDHCAFCPTWTHAKACREHPLITIATNTRFVGLENTPEGVIATLAETPSPIDAEACIFCGQCFTACPRKAIAGHAKDLPLDPSTHPVSFLDTNLCDLCGVCKAACPIGAITLDRQEKTLRLAVSDCIFAGGFQEPTPESGPIPAPEFGAYSHPDILTAMAFEKWSAEFRANHSTDMRCPSDNRPVKRLAFIQCAGARDKRHLEHCSAVCCMHASKQASWMKRRRPDLDVIVLYTDLRGPGKGQEAYIRNAEKTGVRFYRRRPGLVAPVESALDKGVAIRHETEAGVGTTVADLVILNGGLACCPHPETASAGTNILAENHCGFCAEPADIAHSVIQAGSTAALAYMRRHTGKATTRTTIAVKEGKNA